jgi:mono/diheme cytochrome c family protein
VLLERSSSEYEEIRRVIGYGPGNSPYMHSKALLTWSIALIAVGVLGLGVVWALGLRGMSFAGSGTFTSAGQRIYYTGQDADGRVIPRTIAGGGMMGLGMMGDVACVDCHGEDGRGGRIGMMFGTVDIADIRYSTLTTSRSEDGTTVPAWTDNDIARAIRDGVEPNGQRLKAPMPRWNMTDGEVTDVIDYLKELDTR